jgi:hypothetical protein
VTRPTLADAADRAEAIADLAHEAHDLLIGADINHRPMPVEVLNKLLFAGTETVKLIGDLKGGVFEVRR